MAPLPSAFFPLPLCLFFPLLLFQQVKHSRSHHTTPGTVLMTRCEDKPHQATLSPPWPGPVALISLSLLFLPLLPSSSSSLSASSLPAFFSGQFRQLFPRRFSRGWDGAGRRPGPCAVSESPRAVRLSPPASASPPSHSSKTLHRHCPFPSPRAFSGFSLLNGKGSVLTARPPLARSADGARTGHAAGRGTADARG